MRNTKTTEAKPARLTRVSEAADLLAVSTRTIWKMIAAGELPAVRLGKRTTRIPVDAIERLVTRLQA